MKKKNAAEIGCWYQTPEGERFKVVAEDDDSIEIQYANGDVAELDQDSWWEMGLRAISTPDDGAGPFDELSGEDFGDTERPYHPEELNNPVDTIESDNEIDWED
ncbi:MAG: hypothetical protein OEX12_10390 [Gammaproteobacteria bacterium]|nr:hypothetical protein [Gammaproteobacteria bacterium]